jgi:hypothetical protein
MNKETRITVWNKFNNRCSYCGEKIRYEDMQVDHVIPKLNFKTIIKNKQYKVPLFLKHITTEDLNHIDNLFPSCRICNKRKDTYHLELFRFELSQQSIRAFKTSSNYRMALKYNQIIETPSSITFYFEQYQYLHS